MKLSSQIRRLMLNSVRSYFAPLVGAFKGIRAEMHRVDREIALHRQDDDQPKKKRHASRLGDPILLMVTIPDGVVAFFCRCCLHHACAAATPFSWRRYRLSKARTQGS